MTLFWVVCALFGQRIAPYDPIDESFGAELRVADLEPPLRARPERARRALARHRRGPQRHRGRACGALLGVRLGSMLGLVMGYFGGWIDNVLGRVLDAVLAIPLIVLAILVLTALSAGNEGISVSSWQLIVVIGIVFTLRWRGPFGPPSSPSATSTTCRPRSCEANTRRTSCSPRSSRT